VSVLWLVEDVCDRLVVFVGSRWEDEVVGVSRVVVCDVVVVCCCVLLLLCVCVVVLVSVSFDV
jgi:hypothetical protein